MCRQAVRSNIFALHCAPEQPGPGGEFGLLTVRSPFVDSYLSLLAISSLSNAAIRAEAWSLPKRLARRATNDARRVSRSSALCRIVASTVNFCQTEVLTSADSLARVSPVGENNTEFAG